MYHCDDDVALADALTECTVASDTNIFDEGDVEEVGMAIGDVGDGVRETLAVATRVVGELW